MSSRAPNVLPDANVLYSRTLRDWICLLATRSGPPLFHLRWTEDVLAELVYHLRKNHPHYSDRQIGGVRDKIVDIVAVHGRISGYEIDPDLAYTDEYDAHLHAAAEHGDVQYVMTSDGGFHDFAAVNDELLGYEVYTPDDFLMLVYRDALSTFREALLDQIAYHRRLGKPFNLAARLEAAQAPKFAAAIREMMQAPAVARALAAGRASGHRVDENATRTARPPFGSHPHCPAARAYSPSAPDRGYPGWRSGTRPRPSVRRSSARVPIRFDGHMLPA